MMTPNNAKQCDVAILAGGMGTRLKSRTGDLPKPMAPVLGRPVLEHQIEMCRRHGFTRIALLVHYASEVIREHFGDGSRFGVELSYCVETDARGTAGALRDALPAMASRFIVLYGDTYADINLRALWDDHARSGAAATLLLHPNDHPHDSDLVEIDAHKRVVAVHPYPHPAESVHANLVNAALYVLERNGLEQAIPATGRSDLAKHTFPAMLAAGTALHAYVTPEYIKDMGTPERLDKVERDILAGLPERLSDRHPRSAVFLDRDGTLNVEVNRLSDPAQLRLIDGAGEAVRALNRAGVLAVGITNQPVVARGDVSWRTLDLIHATLDQQLGAHKAWLDRLYVCPHHPDAGFEGEVRELKIRCDCRKPEAGLIDRAVRELRISRRHSWMVGDTLSDMLAGARAGLRTVLVRTGHAGQDTGVAGAADYTVPDIAAAIDWILRGHAAMAAQVRPLVARAAASRLVLIGGPARAGKSSVARVLAEQLDAGARGAHVVSLDGWLRPVEQRAEGAGVAERYDLAAVRAALQPLVDEPGRHHVLEVPVYNRRTRTSEPGPGLSVAPDDILIVEGVPALLDSFLVASSALRVFVDVDDRQRQHRLQADYAWRDATPRLALERLESREKDEVPLVRASASHATDRIESTGE
jgi:D,D-heptose 1,7-bisphosphate phosphatase